MNKNQPQMNKNQPQMNKTPLHSKLLNRVSSPRQKLRGNPSPSRYLSWCSGGLILGTAVMIAAPSAQAALILYNNGQDTNVVSTTLNQDDWIRVENSSGGDPTTVTFESGAVVRGQNFGRSVVSTQDSVLQFNGGYFDGYIQVSNNSSVTVNLGTLNDGLAGFNSSTITFSGGTVSGSLEFQDSASVTINGGRFERDITVWNTSPPILRI